MTDPDNYTLLHTASTQQDAEMLHSLLEASGIPAHVEGVGLADEFASIRRLANLVSVRVFVREQDLEAGRELIGGIEVTSEELTRQAMAADAPEALSQSSEPGPSKMAETQRAAKMSIRVLLVIYLLGFLFAAAVATTLLFL